MKIENYNLSAHLRAPMWGENTPQVVSLEELTRIFNCAEHCVLHNIIVRRNAQIMQELNLYRLYPQIYCNLLRHDELADPVSNGRTVVKLHFPDAHDINYARNYYFANIQLKEDAHGIYWAYLTPDYSGIYLYIYRAWGETIEQAQERVVSQLGVGDYYDKTATAGLYATVPTTVTECILYDDARGFAFRNADEYRAITQHFSYIDKNKIDEIYG